MATSLFQKLQSRSRDHANDHDVFDAMLRRHLFAGAVILDAGAGPGVRYPYDYAKHVARVVGVDIDPAVRQNENVDYAVVTDLAHLPFETATFDLVFAKYVLEHLVRPLATFREIRRVLSPGGHFVFHTPNRFHYVALAARLTPHRFHVWFRERRRRHHGMPPGAAKAETFPTRYRANDRRTLTRLAGASHFRVAGLEMIEPEPDYLFFHPAAFRAGIAYEQLVTRTERLADLRCVIVGDLEAI